MTAHLLPENFDSNARAALHDDNLRKALRKATDLFAGLRKTAVGEMPEWEQLRERARAIKEESLSHLDRYLEEFVANAERAGARVHWARDAREACARVGGIARAAGARKLVKSKSMTTEEIRLNDALESDGMLPVETDLGEWIIQLAGEMPSHIIAPAIHKTKQQISQLFVEKLQIEPTEDINELTAAARRILRRYFAESDLGVSGVNFGVAETGTILVLENEGNARMTTSLPRVHVAVMGIEKVIPRFLDLSVFLRLLPRSGTGQHLTSYQSLITGTKDQTDGEGPDEVHILLLDNGRSAMLRNRVTRQSLACIRCGACLNICPVYQQVGGHAYGSVYPGPIGAVITPQLSGLEKASQLPFASSLCGACRDVCPVKIDIPELLLELRSRIKEGGGLPHTSGGVPRSARNRKERLAFAFWAWVVASPRRFRWATGMARRFSRNGRPGPLASRLMPPVAQWSLERDLPPLASRSFRDIWRDELADEAAGPSKGVDR